MILTGNCILERGLVGNIVPDSVRSSTYDATVGRIISNGKVYNTEAFLLEPRGIVWVVSAETFNMPKDITGMSTLRTTWTHRGVLALNVGVIDPGYDGPLAAAIVNFGDRPFPIRKGDSFFRVMFIEHEDAIIKEKRISYDAYSVDILDKSIASGDSFLRISNLSSDVISYMNNSTFLSNKISRTAYYIAVFGLLATILSIFVPIAISFYNDLPSMKVDVQALKSLPEKVEKLENEKKRLEKEIQIIRERPADHVR